MRDAILVDVMRDWGCESLRHLFEAREDLDSVLRVLANARLYVAAASALLRQGGFEIQQARVLAPFIPVGVIIAALRGDEQQAIGAARTGAAHRV